MKRVFILACLLAASSVWAEDHKITAEAWFKNDYAPLWKDNPGDNVEAIAGYYVETMTSYAATGGSSEYNSLESMSESIADWQSQSWVSSILTDLETDKLNPATATFKAKWLDVYEDGSEESSCGWYLASRGDDGWKFTTYTDIDCEEHGM